MEEEEDPSMVHYRHLTECDLPKNERVRKFIVAQKRMEDLGIIKIAGTLAKNECD